MNCIAIVPVKGPSEAKRRLSKYLTVNERKQLVIAMLGDVLDTINRSALYSEVIVVSPDKSMSGLAREQGADFVPQTVAGLNLGVQQATDLAKRRGAESTMNILADIPLVEPTDLQTVMTVGDDFPRVVLCPSMDSGTNMMLRAPADAIKHSYGRWSFTKHLRDAQKARLSVYSVSNLRTSFDVDTFDDITALRLNDPKGKTRTGTLLLQLERLHLSPKQ